MEFGSFFGTPYEKTRCLIPRVREREGIDHCYADVMELVVFLSSDGRAARRAGSNPVIRTNQNLRVPQPAIRARRCRPQVYNMLIVCYNIIID